MLSPTSMIVSVTLWVLIAFSVITWTLIVRKAQMQRRLVRLNRDFREAFWNAPGFDEAEAIVNRMHGPLARLCQAGFASLRDLRTTNKELLRLHGDRADLLEASLRQQIQAEQHRLESGLAVLASIGSTAPFVGLFGTVWGIMHALEEIGRSGSASLQAVAGPIGEALIATAIGIATAVPAVLAYNYGVRRLRANVAELDEFAVRFLRVAIKTATGEA